MPRPLGQQVVVVTGAGSGIGRETALTIGRRGATVVVAGRGGRKLESAVTEVQRLGGRGLAVPTDVSDSAQVEALAGRAVEEFGRIDTWVNNAAISTYGTVDQMTPTELGRVIDVNLLGHARVLLQSPFEADPGEPVQRAGDGFSPRRRSPGVVGHANASTVPATTCSPTRRHSRTVARWSISAPASRRTSIAWM